MLNGRNLIGSVPSGFILKLVCENTSVFLETTLPFLHSLFLILPSLNVIAMEYCTQYQNCCEKRTSSPPSYLPVLFAFKLTKAIHNRVTDIHFCSVNSNTYCQSTNPNSQFTRFLEQLTFQQPPKQRNKTWTFTDVL